MNAISRIVIAAIFLSAMVDGAANPARAQEYRHHHHAHYWPGHYYRPYADFPGLGGLIHY
jgi:hypothetical protein